jgi:3-oxocholest-4-en-26-oate---CoA ligase
VLLDDGTVGAIGEVGRLARGGHIPLGYWRDDAKTAATFPTYDGKRWVTPGDFAMWEDDGTITLLGRGSVSINSGGEKIFPEEVESALRTHPSVFDAAVVGTPHERWGEQVTALVHVRDDIELDVADLQAHCRTLIADYKVPKTILAVAAIARTEVGKLDYRTIKQIAIDLIGQ